MALVGESSGGCDFSQAMAALAHQLKGALQAQMHDIAVRGHADRSGEYPREVKRAATIDLGQGTSLDVLIEMGSRRCASLTSIRANATSSIMRNRSVTRLLKTANTNLRNVLDETIRSSKTVRGMAAALVQVSAIPSA
jgi:hypothetical protein